MAAVLVQSASNSTAGAASVAVASANGWAAPTAGNLIVAWITADATVTTPTGFSVGPSVVDQNAVYLWYKIAAGTETTVTFPLGGTTSPAAAGLIEYSGLTATPFDAQLTSSIQVTAGTTTTAVSVTGTGTSGDLWVAVAGLGFTSAGFPTSPTWTNSFTNRQSVSAGAGGSSATSQQAFVADFQNTSAAAASTACSWTNTMQNRQELLIAFKLAAGGAAAQIPTLVMART